MRNPLLVLAWMVVFLLPAAAQEHAGRGTGGDGAAPASVLRMLPADAVSEHRIETPRGALTYTATAGTLPLYDPSGAQTAAVFYTAYVARPLDVRRPLTFVFNGGPGASSAFLHLGLVGPRIVDFGETGEQAAMPRLRDNPETWLAFTDLVLVDPVGTGWSRPAKPDGGRAFWGIETDASALAQVIALYVARNQRGASPKYLLGESYGGFRAAKVARTAQREHGLILSGLVMVSPMLEGHFQFGGRNFALGAALLLPSIAATELERRGALTAEALAGVERFALTDYLVLLAGGMPDGDAAERVYRRVADLTGLALDEVRRARGFIEGAYVRAIRSREGRLPSHYDATYRVEDPFPESAEARAPDPGLDGFVRALASAFVGYAQGELGYRTDLTYRLLAEDIARQWDWGSRRSPPGVGADLRILLAFNPAFRLLVTHGQSDLVTPYAVSRHVLDQLPRPLAQRAALLLYRGGHMFYFDDAARRAMSADAARFYRAR